MAEVSISPSGEEFPLPSKGDYAKEMDRLKGLAAEARKKGQEVVVVMGVGFVGAVMAAIVADTVGKKGKLKGKSSKFVIGCQRPSKRSYWKVPVLNRGQSPVKAEDPEVDPMIAPLRPREEDADGHLQPRLPRTGRLRRRRRAVRLRQGRAGQHADGRDGHGGPGVDAADDRLARTEELPDADRDDGRARHDGVRRHADSEARLRRPRHQGPSRCWPTATSVSCPAGSTSRASGISGVSVPAAPPPRRSVSRSSCARS